METLPLENAFSQICNEKAEYKEFYHIYFATKSILQKHYYPFIKDANPYYTDHGIGHINRILNRLYSLLKDHLLIKEETTPYPSASIMRDDRASKMLNVYELYLLMCSVLWHDIGNLYKRSHHEKNINRYFEKAKNFLHDENSSEWIEKIAEAHSGSNTIETIIDVESKYEKGIPYYPRFLAALLRFSDELDEDKERIGEKLYKELPLGKKAYWFFCKCNDSIHLEEEGDFKIIKVVFESKMLKHELFQKLGKESSTGSVEEVVGIEEYSRRINKINDERKYCSLYLNKFHYFKVPVKIELRLSIYDVDNKTCLDHITFVYDDTNGYNEFFKINNNILEKYRGQDAI